MANERVPRRYLASDAETAFGRRVAELRRSSGLTQEKVAQRMELLGYPIHQTTVAKIEKASRPTSVGEATALAQALGVALADLIREPERPEDADDRASERARTALRAAATASLELAIAGSAFRNAQAELADALGISDDVDLSAGWHPSRVPGFLLLGHGELDRARQLLTSDVGATAERWVQHG